MQRLVKIATKSVGQSRLSRTVTKRQHISATNFKSFSTKPSTPNLSSKKGDDEWNDAWETAWLPLDPSSENSRAPWETGENLSPSSAAESSGVVLPSDADPETKAFVEDMNANWDERRKPKEEKQQQQQQSESGSLYSLENIKKDYRLKKQRIHAGLWMKEIEKQEEAKLADSSSIGGGDDIERLLDRCSE